MRPRDVGIGIVMLVALFGPTMGHAAVSQFAVFPKANELTSPDGRFAVRSLNSENPSTDFNGTFHSLWLFELATGRSQKLCEYLGVAAVAWAGIDSLIVTQYVSKRTSRVLVFSTNALGDPIMLDKNTLTQLVPVEFRPSLRENDHVFVEGSRVEENTLYLRVWGYGRDAKGFRWSCAYKLREGSIVCDGKPTSQ